MSVKIQLFFAISSSIILWGGCDNDKQNQKIDEAALCKISKYLSNKLCELSWRTNDCLHRSNMETWSRER